MLIKRINGATAVIGKSQGYLGLPVRLQLINDVVNGENTPSMVTAWEPTPVELQRLNGGSSVYVRLLGAAHPPIMVDAGFAPDAEIPPPPHGEDPALELALQYLRGSGALIEEKHLAAAFRLMLAASAVAGKA